MTVSEALLHAALDAEGRQYRLNDCGRAVADVFRAAGLQRELPERPEWVPNWHDWGQQVKRQEFVRAGDIIIYNFSGRTPDPADGGGGYDHIGIAIPNGLAINVSTAGGFKFVATPITGFQEGRRSTSVEPTEPGFAVKVFWEKRKISVIIGGQLAWTGTTPDVGEGSMYLKKEASS